MHVEGSVNFDGKTHQIVKGAANAGRDWGRGVWNYNSFWMWSTGQGYLKDKRRFGLDIGKGFENPKQVKAYEDSVFIDGVMQKLGVVYYESIKD